MDVLIADFDFFLNAGGGQTYYRKLVERNPSIRFHFLTRNSDLEQSKANQNLMLPANAFPIPYKIDHRLPYFLDVISKQFPAVNPEIIYGIADESANIAYSVAGKTFDLVDVPSFRPILLFLTAMFKYNNVQCKKYVLSIHGWSHKAIHFSWERDRSQSIITSLLTVEKICLECADIRYEISKFSLEDTKKLTLYKLLYYDIHNTLDSMYPDSKTSEITANNYLPDIWYPARLDRQKGVDLFLDIVSRLPKNLYGKINICGPDGEERGRTWLNRVYSLAKKLEIDIVYHGCLSRDEVIKQVFSQPNYCIFSSRYDSFGLAITEALFSGCPVAASDQCGASHFLREEYPNIPFTLFDVNNLDIAVSKISQDLMIYTQLRNKLQENILKTSVQSWSEDSIKTIYNSESEYNHEQRLNIEKLVFSAIESAKTIDKSVNTSQIILIKAKQNRHITKIWGFIKSILPHYLRKKITEIVSFIKYNTKY